MDERFLLYIDILGFSEMTRRQPRKVARIYAILDSLNVHRHHAFKTIVFSDTVLVYNLKAAQSDEQRNYLVWYLIEFAEDLHHRLTGQDIYFRAVITAGGFSHYLLNNIECFFGEALINAYLQEKAIPSIGLFMENACNKYNEFFRTAPFDEKHHFVYLNRGIESLNDFTGGVYPMKDAALEDMAHFVAWQVRFLMDLYTLMRTHPDPTVRTKFLAAWDFYEMRYPTLLQLLVKGEFSLEGIAGRPAWVDESKAMVKQINYYKRIGSGSPLSLQLTKESRKPPRRKANRSSE